MQTKVLSSDTAKYWGKVIKEQEKYKKSNVLTWEAEKNCLQLVSGV